MDRMIHKHQWFSPLKRFPRLPSFFQRIAENPLSVQQLTNLIAPTVKRW